MARTRSAKGQIVDFDLLLIKQQMQKASPPTATVKAREDFIDKKLRRRVNTIQRQPAVKKELDEAVDVAPIIPGNVEPEASLILEDLVAVVSETKIKQKAKK